MSYRPGSQRALEEENRRQKERLKIQEAEKLDQELRDKAASEKAEKTKDRRFQLLNTLLGAVVGALLTLFVEHFSEILAFFKGLSQSG